MDEKRSGGSDLLRRVVVASRWAAPACVVVIVVLSTVPGDVRPHTGMSGNFEHAMAYLGTGFASVVAVRTRHFIRVLFFLSLLAAGLETAQIWIPGRSAGFDNWAASSAGALVGSVLARFVLARARR